ncbi:MAG TPA: hypothetical protein VKE95_12720 [Burkholderiales bacterium]|nr:hypothetical protein [Burkholderiales bacterium]
MVSVIAALVFVWVVVVLIVFSAILMFRPNHAVSVGDDPARLLGRMIGGWFLPILLALYRPAGSRKGILKQS